MSDLNNIVYFIIAYKHFLFTYYPTQFLKGQFKRNNS